MAVESFLSSVHPYHNHDLVILSIWNWTTMSRRPGLRNLPQVGYRDASTTDESTNDIQNETINITSTSESSSGGADAELQIQK